MSGFGGFGGAPPPTPGTAAGFGSGGFGSGGFGGGGFGTPQAPAAGGGFGAPPPAAAPTATFGGGFGAAAAPSPAPTSVAFGQPQNPQGGRGAGAGTFAFGSSANVAQAPAPAPAPAQAQAGFGFGFGFGAQLQPQPLPQLQPPPPSPAQGGFGGGGFGQPQTQPQQSPPPPGLAPSGGFGSSSAGAAAGGNPFGQTPAGGGGGGGGGGGISFGTSANVASTPGFGSAPAAAAPPSSGFGAPSAGAMPGADDGLPPSSSPIAPPAFGTAPAPSAAAAPGGFGGFGADVAFGKPTQASGGFGGAPAPAASFPSSSAAFGAVPRKKTQPPGGSGGGGSGGGGSGDELARLKAKLEAAKRKKLSILEEKKKQEQRSAGGSGGEAGPGGLHPGARSFRPRSAGTAAPTPPRTARKKERGGSNQIDKAAMAAKNAQRFASVADRSTMSLLPPDLMSKAEASAEDGGGGGGQGGNGADDQDEGGKGELSRAKNLDGTCRAMCPDEELLRREKEGDIQLLEKPCPGLHPADWTLRDTAVKRFRRSAADFKLDIPELVRPPSVLERCVSSLEGGVMERDRQGPDPRFDNAPPPSLDVYQFIWDRTRMIRKDFILQNYIGTGGRCSAAAVRCHERIARWHALAEHQLAHIDKYVEQQSQQNIQELGQAMKTLNQYYDDAGGRATFEEKGSDPTHGCRSDIIIGGKDPVDNDGSTLRNDGSSSTRFIGTKDHPSRATAEPEMRGLYILLTMNNDGGMEVLKYAARLYVQRPSVYNSRPVQLALSIFGAKKEYNYARFFKILRSSDTPYLFACIMFKYVEQMRKTALRIMAKTFGARRKDTGQNMYDSYELQDLVRLLCFEDEEEAREACKHYNITVTEKEGSEWIEWRKTDFKERKHPVKGHIIRLHPRKMIRTIECKLNGASRLAICRGEVSGEGATLSHSSYHAASQQDLEAARREYERKRAAEAEMRARIQREREVAEKAEEERKRKQAEREAKLNALKREKQERERLKKEAEEKEKQRQLAIKRTEEERKEKFRREAEEKKQREEKEKARENARIRAEKEAAENAKAQRKRAEEAARLAAIERKREEERERAKAEERERQRQLEIKRAEGERLAAEARRRAEEAAAKAAEEARRAEEERLRKLREEEERKEREWQRKLNLAKMQVAFRKWKRRVDVEHRGIRQTHHTLENADALRAFSVPHSLAGTRQLGSVPQQVPDPSECGPEHLFYRLGNLADRRVDLSVVIRERLCSFMPENKLDELSSCKDVVSLFKLSFPFLVDEDNATLRLWMHARFNVGTLTSDSKSTSDGRMVEVRSIVSEEVGGLRRDSSSTMALLLIPPFSPSMAPQRESFLENQVGILSYGNIPHAILNLDCGSNEKYTNFVRNLIDEQSRKGKGHLLICEICPEKWTASSLDASLESCLNGLIDSFVSSQICPNGDAFTMDPVSLPHLVRRCLRSVLWDTENIIVEESVEATEQGLLHLVRDTLTCLSTELRETAERMKEGRLRGWPAEDFTSWDDRSKTAMVRNYWSDGMGLPRNWNHLLEEEAVGMMEGPGRQSLLVYERADSVGSVVEHLTRSAPRDVRGRCKEMMWDKLFRRALDRALAWADDEEGASSAPVPNLLYLPQPEIAPLLERTLKRVSELRPPKEAQGAPPAAAAPKRSVLALHGAQHTPARVVDSEWKAASWHPGQIAASAPSFSSPGSAKRSRSDPPRPGRGSPKRPRTAGRMRRPSAAATADQQRSRAFTAQLEELLHGEATVDLGVGAGVALSDLLVRNGAGRDIVLPNGWR